MEYTYDPKGKAMCWYKSVCQHPCDEDDYCIRYNKMDYLVYMATLAGKQRHTVPLFPDTVDFNAFTKLKETQKDINHFVLDGKNLLIFSKICGNGKTEWSKKLLLSWFGSIWHSTDFVCRGLFISMPKLIQSMKENIAKPNEYYQYVIENIYTTDLVVWDEINYKDWSQYEQDFMLNVLSQRISTGKSNIYTTNYDLPTIEKKLGSRLSSRIIGCSDCIELKGGDKRGSAYNG